MFYQTNDRTSPLNYKLYFALNKNKNFIHLLILPARLRPSDVVHSLVIINSECALSVGLPESIHVAYIKSPINKTCAFAAIFWQFFKLSHFVCIFLFLVFDYNILDSFFSPSFSLCSYQNTRKNLANKTNLKFYYRTLKTEKSEKFLYEMKLCP